MTEELKTFGDKAEKLDVSRAVVINELPSGLQWASAQHFNDSIFELIRAKFGLEKDAVDHIFRFPSSDQQEQVNFSRGEHRTEIFLIWAVLVPLALLCPWRW